MTKPGDVNVNLFTGITHKTFLYSPNTYKAFGYKFFDFPNEKAEQVPPAKTKGEELHEKWTQMCPKVSEEFFEKVTEMADRLNFSPEDLCAIMFQESGFKPNAHGKNAKTGADYYGLIQMDATAFKTVTAFARETEGKDCKLDPNMTFAKYAKLPREKQLLYSEAYLKFRINEKGLTGQKLSGGQLWTLINSPANIKNSAFIAKNQAKIDKIQEKVSKFNERQKLNTTT